MFAWIFLREVKTLGGLEMKNEGLVFNIQRWSIHDGPGVRTVVFLKGCPLRCTWCCNPESQEYCNELAFFKDKCIGCHTCIKNCPNGAVKLVDGVQQYDREICRTECYKKGLNSFPCTKECYGKALRPIAELKTVDQVMEEVMKDVGIYKESKVGGLTLSGGEMMSQPGFSLSLLKAAKKNNITTAIETCGVAKWDMYEEILKYVDYLFCDIKFFDAEKHKKHTGQDNLMILENVVKMSQFAYDNTVFYTIRIPLVPTISELSDFRRILDFVRDSCNKNTCVELMPYHRLGRGKYQDLGMEYEYMDLQPYKEEEIKPFKDLLASYGFKENL